MEKNNVLSKKIEVRISEETASVEAIADFWNFLQPYNDVGKEEKASFLRQFETLSENQINEQLALTQNDLDSQKLEVEKALKAYTESVIQARFLNNELAILEKITEIQRYFEKHKDSWNQVIKEEKDYSFDVRITNGIYTMHIFAHKYYNKNFQIRGYISLNDMLSSKSSTSIDSFDNSSYSEVSKVETYIKNKLKKFSYLFSVEKAVLASDVKRFNIHPRIIKELNIQVFDTQEDLLNAVKK